jgi:type VI secretion system protein ImpE
VPFDRISAVEFEAPADLRDLVWCPAKITFATGGEQVAFVPSRYPGSHEGSDDALRLSRRTEWRDLGNETFTGLGQRMLTTDVDDYPLLETRTLRFTLLEPAADVTAASAPESAGA